jgi:signal transduction histidine kinase
LNSTKDRLFSIIAHDLRNPFHTVIGFSELLIKNYKKLQPEKLEKYFNLIHSSSKSGNNLLENLLQWSRSQSGTLSFAPEKLNLWSLIDENISLIEADAHRKNITIQSMVDQEIAIYADENMLKTILRNLFSNAIKFTFEGGRVVADAIVRDKHVEVIISDNGVGISENKIDQIFDVDANETTRGTSNESGTGLGLIICKEFVEKHKGTIWVESEISKGSTFKFTIPYKL